MIKQTLTTIAMAGLLTGCAMPKPRQIDIIPQTQIIVDSEDNINRDFKIKTLYQQLDKRVAGFTTDGSIYVRYGVEKDKNGNLLPDFYTLGHEVWHRVKGSYHK